MTAQMVRDLKCRQKQERTVDTMAFTIEMAVVMGALGFTIFPFVSEIIRVDLAAILVWC